MGEDNKKFEQGAVHYSATDEIKITVELCTTDDFAEAFARFAEITASAHQKGMENDPHVIREAVLCLDKMISIVAPAQVVHQIYHPRKRRTQKKNCRRALKVLSRYIQKATVKVLREG